MELKPMCGSLNTWLPDGIGSCQSKHWKFTKKQERDYKASVLRKESTTIKVTTWEYGKKPIFCVSQYLKE